MWIDFRVQATAKDKTPSSPPKPSDSDQTPSKSDPFYERLRNQTPSMTPNTPTNQKSINARSQLASSKSPASNQTPFKSNASPYETLFTPPRQKRPPHSPPASTPSKKLKTDENPASGSKHHSSVPVKPPQAHMRTPTQSNLTGRPIAPTPTQSKPHSTSRTPKSGNNPAANTTPGNSGRSTSRPAAFQVRHICSENPKGVLSEWECWRSGDSLEFIHEDHCFKPYSEKLWTEDKPEWKLEPHRINALKYNLGHSLIHIYRMKSGYDGPNIWIQFMNKTVLRAFLKCYEDNWKNNKTDEE
jgi:hypothetical protein